MNKNKFMLHGRFDKYSPLTIKIYIALIFMLLTSAMYAAMVDRSDTHVFKQHDKSNYHNVGNMWLRVSNYGFFGSGSDTQNQWPSLEYPGGSGIDYLFQGALWFGAKKVRRNRDGEPLYWRNWPAEKGPNDVVTFDQIPAGNIVKMVVDTLVTVGFDGDRSLYEFLPAYNTREFQNVNYARYNMEDKVVTRSTRQHRRAFDDDGDGRIDEDPVGRDFPFRAEFDRNNNRQLPVEFADFAGLYVHQLGGVGAGLIDAHFEIWYPLGFQDLGYTRPRTEVYNYASYTDDDRDGLVDEDDAPISEQDFKGYYYDYSPFGWVGQRTTGASAGSNFHSPLNIAVRQMSFAWSFDYIKNLVYVEFNITNMHPTDTLYDCAMAIYIDADCGPQSYSGDERSEDDLSGYMRGEGYEFAFSYDADFDGGLTPHYIGVRVCTPDPDSDLVFSCWYWERGRGPNDFDPLNHNLPPGRRTANEKYWLMTGRNPDSDKYQPLRRPDLIDPLFIQDTQPMDTRFLFAFYGDMKGYYEEERTEYSWNLHPGQTMKIVVAVFPGDTIEDLKTTARHAKAIYGEAQNLLTVTLPDIFPHYEPPEPPIFPRMYAEMVEPVPNQIDIDVYWDNRSEFSMNYILVERNEIGWRPGTDYDSDPTHPDVAAWMAHESFPVHFRWDGVNWDESPFVNPFTGHRLRHDFEGYSLWGRSARGNFDSWMLFDKWDRFNTDLDKKDYVVNQFTDVDPETSVFNDRTGDMGRDRGLPNPLPSVVRGVVEGRPPLQVIDADFLQSPDFPDRGRFYDYSGAGRSYYRLDEFFLLKAIAVGDTVFGIPLYNTLTRAEAIAHPSFSEQRPLPDEPRPGDFLTEAQKILNRRIFKHPMLDDKIFDALVDDALIPLPGHLGQNKVVGGNPNDLEALETPESEKDRLARRYYTSTIQNVPKGREYYVSVTAFNRGMPAWKLPPLESGRDANVRIFFPGPVAKSNMNNIYVVPNPYRGSSNFDGHIDGDDKGDKGRRIWFVNLPMRCNVQIYTLAGDLVAEFEHNGMMPQPIISTSKAASLGIASSGIHPWNLLSRNNQIIASGLYFFSVKCRDSGDVKVGKFAVIR
jgi:hypothetical protein